jgi:hypothetical protein
VELGWVISFPYIQREAVKTKPKNKYRKIIARTRIVARALGTRTRAMASAGKSWLEHAFFIFDR